MLAQTHDSGSNNNTLAEAMNVRLTKYARDRNEVFKWDHKSDRVRCVCHKLALMVNAGLQALGIQAPPPPLVKTSMLGEFPVQTNTLQTVAEEDKTSEGKVTDDNDSDSEDEVDDADIGQLQEDSNWYEVVDGPYNDTEAFSATNRNEANAVHLLTTKVSLVFLFHSVLLLRI